MTLNIDMREHAAIMEARVERMRRVCRQYSGALSNKNKPYSNRTYVFKKLMLNPTRLDL